MMTEEMKKLLQAVLPTRVVLRIRLARGWWWDWWHGVETTDHVELSLLRIVGSNRSHGVLYTPTSHKMAKAILSRLELDYPQYTFIDFGSGKGRVLLIASGFPFKAVIGVEFAEELHRVATENVCKYRRATVCCSKIRCFLKDAADFVLPVTPLVLFFANPFAKPVMSAVMENLQRSLAECPRDVWIVCRGQWTPTDVIEQLPWITILWRDVYAVVYRVVNGCNNSPGLSGPPAQVDDAGCRVTEDALYGWICPESRNAVGVPQASVCSHPALMPDFQTP
jgi:predicted RNA methylase